MAAKLSNPHLYAIVAGELSGDNLGAGLMLAILRRDPEAKFIGIGGPKMIACGLLSSFRLEQLSVMGLTEVISHLMPILKIRKQIFRIISDANPCVFIGIDSPDFNLTLERKLHNEGIPTVHYVSPSVWAWRRGRMKKIRAACDHILALLKFEKDFFDKEGMPCTYVGHTLANSIPLEIDENLCRERLDLFRTSVEPVTDKVLGILPGSRAGVIERMLPIYTRTARIIKKEMPKICFISTVPNYELATLVKDIWLENAPDLSLTIYVGNQHEVIASCSAVLLTSGTVALETMLLKKPFAVAYRVSALSAAVGRHLIKVRTFSLPNLIASRRIVNEFIQDQCTPEALSEEMIKLLTSDNLLMKKEFMNIHASMRCNSDELAADAVFKVIGESRMRKEMGHEDGLKADKSSVAAAQAQPVEKQTFKNDIEPKMTLPTSEEVLEKSSKTEPKF